MYAFGHLVLVFSLTFGTLATYAQSSPPVQSDRIGLHPNLTAATRLPGHIPLWARAEADLGPVPDATPLRVTLVLARSPERQAAFTQLLADQQNPASPAYHRWLTPQQVGEQYGPTQHDIDALSAWLTSRGLTVTALAPSRVFLEAAGPAATIASTFSTTLHTYTVDGTTLRAPTIEPALPTAFAAIVASVNGLAEAPLHPMHRLQSAPAPQDSTLHPDYTTSSTSHYVTPGDFATIFDLKPTYSAGYNGAGQKVAIIGRSRVVSTDISEFETNTGLPANLPNTIIPPTGVDPGTTGNGDQSEATLDVVRVIGTAPGVQADLVISGTAGGFNGIYVAAQYNVQTLLDPVMNISFGSCEVYAGPSQVNLWDTLFAQAASEGISVFVSAADSGAATCDTQFAAVPAYQFRSINYICASSYATCVGGTEFADTVSPSTFWSSTNGTDRSSALSYIPEGAWNEPTSGTSYVAASGGGGASIYIPKPTWQTGTGIPADGARDVPDVSFPASAHDGYYACYAAGGGDCANSRFEYFSGTSAAAPGMAAVTAILNQRTGSSHGNLNPLLYRTAATTPAAFHDATPASSGVANCSTAIASMCNNSLPGPTSLTGGLAGYALTTGYDQATGLGSLDITAFLNANATPATTLAPGKLTLTEASSTIANTQTDIFTATYTSTTAGTPTGTVQFYANNTALGAPVPLTAAGKAITAAIPFPAAGSYDITAIYSGDASFAQTTAPGIALTVTGFTASPKVTLSTTVIPVGTNATLTATFTAANGNPAPTGIVRFYAVTAGVGSYIATAPVVNGVGTTTLTFSTAGSYTVTAYYLGDTVYSPSSSTSVAYTVQKLQSTIQLSATSTAVGVGGYKDYTVTILGVTSGSTAAKATGTIQLYANGIALGSPFTLASNINQLVLSPPELFTVAGTYTITASYSGDANWLAATGGATPLTVVSNPASYQIAALPSTLSINAGDTTNDAAVFLLLGNYGFQGTVNLACTVTYNGTGTATSLPTCSFTSSSQTVSIDSTTPQNSIIIQTLATRSVNAPVQKVALSTLPGILAGRSFGGALLAALLLWIPLRNRRSWKSMTSLFSLFLLAFAAGCGSSTSQASSQTTATPIPGTTKGSYTVTITSSTNVAGTPTPAPVTLGLTVN